MNYKNATTKPIGFGKDAILPDESAPLPPGYGPSHPVVKFYIAKGWLVPDNQAAAQAQPEPAAPANSNALTAEIAAVNKANKAELLEKCGELGIQCSEVETNDALRKKIIDRLKAAG